jgi:hypothetical protein
MYDEISFATYHKSWIAFAFNKYLARRPQTLKNEVRLSYLNAKEVLAFISVKVIQKLIPF